MEKKGKLTSKKLIIILASFFVVCGVVLGILLVVRNYVKEVSTKEKYEYYNPDETKADTDEGFKIDGVLDEDIYQKNTWLYARNENGDSYVDLAMTSYYGEKGMYFAYDVTESTNIYVNSDRSNYCNSGIEMYMAPSNASNLRYNNTYEMNLLPTGELGVYRSGGTGGFVRGETQEQNMPYLGATTKGGEVNSPDCHGYYLELFIPWEYFESQGSDMEEIKNNYMFINPAHITSYNESGTDLNADRLWYSFATQLGGDGWSDVTKYFKFDEQGLVGTVPITFEEGEHYTITGSKTVLPGMKAYVTITPEEGYALNSVRVNGEERIKKVSYKEDGSVTLALKSKGEAITVGASAEKVTEGNKTLRGVVYPHKVDGGSLKDIEISYRGPQGEKPITLDANGAFELPDLKQGYYTITVSKTGYQTLNHGISLKRDIDAELYLEYDMFAKESGTCWDIEEQNAGILTSIGGNGIVLSKDSYDKFSVEGNFRYNESIKEVTDHDYYEQQRIGIRIKFSNGKYWHIDVLQQEGEYLVQYAELTGKDSIYSWTKIHTMTTAEAAKYKSASGINLKVVRDGQYANVYLDDKFVAAEDFGDEYKDLKAQIGFESYAATDGIETLKFAIQTNKIHVVKTPYFSRGGGWNITNQFQGVITLPKGGHNERLKFSQKYTDMDLTITVRDYADGKDDSKDSPRTDVKFIFDNDKCVTFSVLQRSADGDVIIQSMGDKNALTGWPTHYKFTDAEKAQFRSATGVKFRIVRIGTEFALYINDTMVKSCDFEGKIEASTKADIYLRHWGDEGVDVEVPFSMTAKLNKVTIQDTGSKNGKVTGDRKTYQIGDKVVLSGKGNDGYYCTGIKVDGKEVTLGKGGAYTFIAEKSSYKVEGTFTKSLFKDGGVWDISKQNEGTISLYGGGYQSINFVDKYDTMDLTLTVKDSSITAVGKTRRVGVLFEFDNGKKVCFSILNNNWGKDGKQDYKEYIIQTVGQGTDDLISKGNARLYRMRPDQIEAFTSEEGLDFRIVKDGARFYLYLGGTMINCEKNLDFTEAISGSTSAKVTISHWQGVGCDMTIPFSVSKDIPEIKPVKNIFANETTWDVSNQNEGKVTQYGGGYQTIDFADKYDTMDLTLTVKDGKETGVQKTRRVGVIFEFTNGKKVCFSILNNNWSGPGYKEYIIQTLGQNTNDLINTSGNTRLHKMTNDEIESFTSDEGIDFRIVKDGAKFQLYLNGTLIKSEQNLDFTKAIGENTVAKVTLAHWGAVGEDLTIPFIVKTEIPKETPNIFASGSKWDISKQSEGKVTQSGGGHKTVDFYHRYDTMDLTLTVKNGTVDGEKRRIGVIFEFANGKKVGFTLLNNNWDGNDHYMIQTPELSGEVLIDKWKTLHNMTDSEKKAFDSDNGIDFRIVKDGAKFYLYLNNVYITPKEKLDFSEVIGENTVAKVTLAHWGAKGENLTIPFSVSKEIRKTFVTGQQWDASKQLEGKVTQYNGGHQTIDFADKYDTMDLTLKVKDGKATGKFETRRVGVIFEFTNGKKVCFSILNNNWSGPGYKEYIIQTLGQNTNDLINISGNTRLHKMTQEEIDVFTSDEGIDFRIVKDGARFYLYLNGTLINSEKSLDFTDVIDGDVSAKVTLAHWGANGENLTIPFSVGTKIPLVKQKTFVAGTNWDISKQDKGEITQYNGGNQIIDFADKYDTMDLTLKVKDGKATGKFETRRVGVIFEFTNGKKVCFSILNNNWSGPGYKEYIIQTLGQNTNDLINTSGNTRLHKMTNDEIESFTSDEGIDFRIVKDGAKFQLYLNGTLIKSEQNLDFTSVIGENTVAKVTLAHWGAVGEDLTIPFIVKTEIPKETPKTLNVVEQNMVTGYALANPVATSTEEKHTTLAGLNKMMQAIWNSLFSKRMEV